MTKQQKEWAAVCETAAKSASIISPALAVTEIRRIIEQTNGYEFEHLVAVFMNSQHQIVGSAIWGIGGLAGANAEPAILFKKFFTTKGATCLIVGHNHPSGSVESSAEDRFFGSRLNRLAKDMGVDLLDNLVVTHNRYSSIPSSLTN